MSALGAAMVLLANLLLRPLAYFLDRHATTCGGIGEIPVHYVLRAVCFSQQENHIRSLLLQSVSGRDLPLQALQSADTQDAARIEVRADLQTEGRRDALLEQVVARLSLEESISAVRWEVASANTDDEEAPLPVLAARPNSPEEETLI